MSGLIPQSFIDDLLNRVDIVDVVSSRIQLKKSGKNYSACCPFHHEKTPSFTVSPDKQFYYCFGCGASGSALGFVMDYDHLDFPQAVEVLAKQAGLEIPYEDRSSNRAHRESIDSPLYKLLASASEYYQHSLKTHPAKKSAVDYFKGRGLTGVIARDYGLGFAPPGWDNLIKYFEADDTQQKVLIDAGLVVENSETGRRYDRFRDRVMFPIRDMKGRVIAFGGRVLGDDKPKYLNSPETPVFHKGEVLYGLYEVRKNNRQLDEIMVLEGYMDVIALAQFGFKNAVATLGTSTSEEHIKRLFRIVSNILFCFDGDAAGRKAAWRALESALPHLQDGRRIRFLFLPDGEDPDSLIRNEGEDAFRARISQQAQPLADYFFTHLMEEAPPDTLEGKAHLASVVTPLLSKIPKGSLQTLMYQRLSEITGLEQTRLEDSEQVVKIQHMGNVHYNDYSSTFPVISKQAKKQRPKVDTLVMRALRYLLQKPELAKKIQNIDSLSEATDNYSQLLLKTISIMQSEPDLNSYQLMGKLIGLDKDKLLKDIIDKEQLIGEDDDLEKEFIDTILTLTVQQSERKLDELLKKDYVALTEDEKIRLRALLKLKAES